MLEPRAKPSQTGLLASSGPEVFDVAVAPDSIARAIAFLNALVMVAEARGDRIVKGNRALVFFVDDEALDFKIVEQTTRSKHTPTEAERAAIVDGATWEAAQKQLKGNGPPRQSATNIPSHSLLAGLVFDASGDRLRPTHATKTGRRYRYYVSGRLADKADAGAESWRLPAAMLEDVVVRTLVGWLRNPLGLVAASDRPSPAPHVIATLIATARGLITKLQSPDPGQRRAALQHLVRRIEIHSDALTFTVDRNALLEPNGMDGSDDPDDDEPIVRSQPMALRRRGVEAKLVLPGPSNDPSAPDPHLFTLLARAHRWRDQLASGAAITVSEIARRDGVDRSEVSLTLPLAFLAPGIVDAILAGRQPAGLTAKRLKRGAPLPLDWTAQRRMLGFDS